MRITVSTTRRSPAAKIRVQFTSPSTHFDELPKHGRGKIGEKTSVFSAVYDKFTEGCEIVDPNEASALPESRSMK